MACASGGRSLVGDVAFGYSEAIVPTPLFEQQLSDAELAQAIMREGPRARESEAELCRRFSPRVRSFGLRHLSNSDAADELCQRVLLLVLEKLRAGQVQKPERIAPFILGVARMTTKSMRRAGARLEPLPPDSLLQQALSVTPRSLDIRRLSECLKQLSERERSVIVLSFLEELDSAEISAAIGLKSGNVRVLRHRALGALRGCFEREGNAA